MKDNTVGSMNVVTTHLSTVTLLTALSTRDICLLNEASTKASLSLHTSE